jgi:hypothetical protein
MEEDSSLDAAAVPDAPFSSISESYRELRTGTCYFGDRILESGQNGLADRASALDQRVGSPHVFRRDLSYVGLESGADAARVH